MNETKSQLKKIINIRAKINEIEMKKTTARISETKNCFFEKIKQN